MDYIANNIVESKFFKKMINFFVYMNLIAVLFETSVTTEYKRDQTQDVPSDWSFGVEFFLFKFQTVLLYPKLKLLVFSQQ